MATSAITFSGFNDIDFNAVLNSLMDQESLPLTALQDQQAALQKTDSNYALLATKIGTLQSAAADLSSSSSLVTYTGSSSDPSALGVSAGTAAVPGRYEVVVNELAHTQVTVSDTTSPDVNTTVVASGGALTIGGEAVTLSGPVTLQQLASAINGNTNVPATASIVQTAPGAYRLVLSSKETGAANAFTMQNALTSTTMAFADTDGDGLSGNSEADNTVNATDASLLINNIAVTSTSNVLDSGIPGLTLTLLQQDAGHPMVVTVGRDDSALADRVDTFVSAYNDLVKFATDQGTAAGNGTTGTLGRDTLLRSLRNQLRDTLAGAHGSAAFTHLSEIGVGFNRTGQLTFDRTAFSAALQQNPAAVQSLFTDAGTGAFSSIRSLASSYIQSGGFVPDARSRVSDEISRLGQRIDDLTARLAVRRQSLQQQFIAADQAMTSLKAQQSALSSFATGISTPL
jgi:flagellar hook-associated protein 2